MIKSSMITRRSMESGGQSKRNGQSQSLSGRSQEEKGTVRKQRLTIIVITAFRHAMHVVEPHPNFHVASSEYDSAMSAWLEARSMVKRVCAMSQRARKKRS